MRVLSLCVKQSALVSEVQKIKKAKNILFQICELTKCVYKIDKLEKDEIIFTSFEII